jgi:hypothetical protein
LHADGKADLGADVVQFLGDRELVERLGTAVEHHPRQGGNGDVARFGHGIARGQHAENDDHIFNIAAIGDQIDSVDF